MLHLSRHLGRRFAEHVAGDMRHLDQEDRLLVAPLVFGLLPRSAIVRARYDAPVKPLLSRHLDMLGVAQTPGLLEVLKAVADQYYRTAPGPGRPRKWGLADVKASDPALYREMLRRQCGRCVYCGRLFDGTCEETLDHIVPWRLVGDVGEGSNWQVTCRDCNVGKSSFISGLQLPEAHNWIYDAGDPNAAQTPLRTRFVALASTGFCQAAGCGATASTATLHVVFRFPDALPIVDHLVVACARHVGERWWSATSGGTSMPMVSNSIDEAGPSQRA